MASTYSGNPGNVSFTLPVTAQIPADGDPLNAASINAALQKLADYLASIGQGGPAALYAHLIGAVSSSTLYIVFPGISIATPADAADSANPIQMPFAGVLRNLRVGMRNAAISGGTLTTSLFKNGGSTSMSCIIANGTQYASDTTHTVSFAAGDTISFHLNTSSGISSGGTGVGVAVQVTGG